jgi:DNA-binding transcriptional ArsR family regulator
MNAHENALEQMELERVTQLFKVLGDSTRLQIIKALEYGEMCVCDLAAFLGISESAVSHQLRTLRQLQLVANRREGPVLYYRLNDNHIHNLLGMVLEHVRE